MHPSGGWLPETAKPLLLWFYPHFYKQNARKLEICTSAQLACIGSPWLHCYALFWVLCPWVPSSALKKPFDFGCGLMKLNDMFFLGVIGRFLIMALLWSQWVLPQEGWETLELRWSLYVTVPLYHFTCAKYQKVMVHNWTEFSLATFLHSPRGYEMNSFREGMHFSLRYQIWLAGWCAS